jgi:hypothetical protein
MIMDFGKALEKQLMNILKTLGHFFIMLIILAG